MNINLIMNPFINRSSKSIGLTTVIASFFSLALLFSGPFVTTANAQEDIEGTYTLMPMSYQSVPKAISNASGIFTLKIQNDTLMVKGKFEGLTSPHHRSFIGVGEKGKMGNVLFTLDVELLNEQHTNGKVEYSDNKFALSEIHKQLIREKEFYVAVSSNNYKMGEIRDQLIVED